MLVIHYIADDRYSVSDWRFQKNFNCAGWRWWLPLVADRLDKGLNAETNYLRRSPFWVEGTSLDW